MAYSVTYTGTCDLAYGQRVYAYEYNNYSTFYTFYTFTLLSVSLFGR